MTKKKSKFTSPLGKEIIKFFKRKCGPHEEKKYNRTKQKRSWRKKVVDNVV